MSGGTSERDCPQTRGVVFIHSCPRALMTHVEWCLTGLLGPGIRLTWESQPVLPGTHRAEIAWAGTVGLASEIASALRAFPGLRFEVTRDPIGEVEGERYCCTPALGMFRTVIGMHGDSLVGEDRLRSALHRSVEDGADLVAEIHGLLGTSWDQELEPFRYAGDGADVRVLHRVG